MIRQRTEHGHALWQKITKLTRERDAARAAVAPLMAFAESFACECAAKGCDGEVEHDCAPDAEEARQAIDEANAALASPKRGQT